ncbi:ion channel [Cyanobium sp. LEGE 06113]|jgi:inward rectifier potassium channel|uniref:ion channel n=1 Tax=Cyanobium sp. LEGE 06113 TaxID=1297573 RepID=UPI001882FDC7|nr:ion channel [Cyanobium sp. LEGE 06113]MBE9154515.1 potassium transporter [Cyanobium sp. LEGE 06113]
MARVQHLRRKHGLLTAQESQRWWRHWREPYLLALSLSWPLFLGLLALVYLAINLLFASLYLADPAGLAGTAAGRASFAEAFFFSVQTLGSIGYGALHPVSLYVNLLVVAESFSGLLFIALSTGLVFARFSRSSARIRFSKLAVVHRYNGLPTLSFRLANERGNNILEARVRAYLSLDEISHEGHHMRRLLPLPLERDQGIAFLLVWTAQHRIDASSPLHGLSVEALERLNAELVVSFSGVDETIERPIHSRCSWPMSRIGFGLCFLDMVEVEQVKDGDDRHRIDWSAFDRTRNCPLKPAASLRS